MSNKLEPDAGYVTGINTSFIDSYTSSHIQTDVLQNITEDFFIPEEKMPPEEIYLPLSMQFDFNKSYEYSTLPDALKYKVTVDVDSTEGNLLHYENTLPQIAGKPFVLDFAPATPADEQKIQDGAPAYEISVTPKLYLSDNYTTETDTMYGGELNITLEVSLVETTTVEKKIYAVEKTAIVMDAPRTEFMAYNETFERVKALQETGDNEILARESLYLIGSNFFLSSDFYTDALADSYNTRWTRVKPGMVFVTKESKVEHFGGVPISITNGGTSVDLKHDWVALSAGKNETIVFNLQRGLTVSSFEGTVLESFYEGVKGISTVSILGEALEVGEPVHFISQGDIERLDVLAIPDVDKRIIRNLLLQSDTYIIMVPNQAVQIGNWSGVGYVIIDAGTGAGKYIISGGLGGGSTDGVTPDVLEKNFLDEVCNAITGKDFEQAKETTLVLGAGLAVTVVVAFAYACVVSVPTGGGAVVVCSSAKLAEISSPVIAYAGAFAAWLVLTGVCTAKEAV